MADDGDSGCGCLMALLLLGALIFIAPLRNALIDLATDIVIGRVKQRVLGK